MKHTLLILLTLFCLSAPAQVYIGYSIPQIELMLGVRGERELLDDGGMSCGIKIAGDMWYYTTDPGTTLVSIIIMSPSPEGYKRWIATLNKDWYYQGDDSFFLPLDNGETLYCMRHMSESLGRFVFLFK